MILLTKLFQASARIYCYLITYFITTLIRLEICQGQLVYYAGCLSY